jgi:serine/threonine protein kinase
MGEVYRARDTRLGRDVAVKVLPQHLSASPEDRARFKREAKTISSLNHPHICVLHDVGQEGDTDYLVMELVEGETLAKRIARGPLPTLDVLRLGAQIADALDRAHRAGIVHRDLKPGNVMLTKSGAKLMDFGLARSAGRSVHGADDVTATAPAGASKSDQPITAKGTIVGTYQYMAPEQLEGKKADVRSDIWALGCVLYEMATGKRAFEGTTAASIISAIMRDQPREMAALAPMAPPAFERLVLQCLAKDPDDRWQTAGDLRRELLWIGEAGSRAGTPVPASRPAWRERVGWALTVALAATAIALFVSRVGNKTDQHFNFTPITLKPMSIGTARFMPDGKTIVFGAAQSTDTTQVFVIRPEYPEPQPISEPGVDLLSVSSQGELAVLVKSQNPEKSMEFGFTLARMQLGSRAPREVLQDVADADWSPDGSQLAVLRTIGEKRQIEFPIGNVLPAVKGYISDIRFSPRGDRIAYFSHADRGMEGGSVNIVDLHGKSAVLSDGYQGLNGIAWSPDGREIFFSARHARPQAFAVYAVTVTGKVRRVIESAGGLRVGDVSRSGRWLLARDDARIAVMVHKPEWSQDRDLSWLDRSTGGRLSRDGSKLAFTERGGAGGKQFAACLRKTDGSAVIRLGDGEVLDLSDDGKLVLTLIPSEPPQLAVISTGAGGMRRLNRGPLASYGPGSFLPGADSVVFGGFEPGKAQRSYIQDFSGRPPRPVTPEATYCGFSVLDGKNVWAVGVDGHWFKYPISDGAPVPVPALHGRDFMVSLDPDGRSALVTDQWSSAVARVEQVDLITGSRKAILNIAPANRSGLEGSILNDISGDRRTYSYTASWRTSVLFLVEAEK